jgi:CDP-6-deoxy-D-xylo-4-hexulose-3-dehydrase
MELSSLVGWKNWEKPGDQHAINRVQWGAEEKAAIEGVFNSDWFGPGSANYGFQKKLEEYTGIPHIHLTNSGSSALMIAIHDLMDQRRLQPGDYVLHPITTFSTSIAPAVRMGAVPVFIETKDRTYVTDPEQVERAVKRYPRIKGMILPHLLGNISDLKDIKKILGERWLVEDCCDTLGGTYEGDHVGTFGDYAAFSFYGSHHITALGVGGAIGVKGRDSFERARSLISWGRDFSIGDGFLDRYRYSSIGTDSLMTAAQAAFGRAQMGRLPEFVEARAEQFKEMMNIFGRHERSVELPLQFPGAKPSWFSFPLVIREGDGADFTRNEFVDYLTNPKNNVEVRPIMCGNILGEKAYQGLPHVTLDDSAPIGDKIASQGLFIPCWGMPREQRDHYHGILEAFLDGKR